MFNAILFKNDIGVKYAGLLKGNKKWVLKEISM